MSGIGTVEFVFLLLLFFIVAFGILARKLGTPYPIIMVVGGLLLSFVPAVPDITLEPDLIFLVVLPPLLYASAWTTSWRDFRYNLVSISFLAFGLVAFTVIGVALAAPHVFRGFDWRLGLVLGAIVAPTDAIAATSIARRIGLPSRIVDLLEGESLINDASGLLALEFAVGILVEKRIPTAVGGLLTFVWLTAGGVAIGLAIGWIVGHFERWIEDTPIQVTISILGCGQLRTSSLTTERPALLPIGSYRLGVGVGVFDVHSERAGIRTHRTSVSYDSRLDSQLPSVDDPDVWRAVQRSPHPAAAVVGLSGCAPRLLPA
jgi:NhaP-type Na+/H+ or K+/H+ antiporter